MKNISEFSTVWMARSVRLRRWRPSGVSSYFIVHFPCRLSLVAKFHCRVCLVEVLVLWGLVFYDDFLESCNDMFFFVCWDWECMNEVAVITVNYEHIVVARYGRTNKTSSLIWKGTTYNFYVVNENIFCMNNFFSISREGLLLYF